MNIRAETLESLLRSLRMEWLSVCDLSGRMSYVTGAYTALSGWTEKELLGKTVQSFVFRDDQARVAKHYAEHPQQVLRWRMLCKDGSMRWMDSTTRVMSEAGKSYVLAVHRDVGTELPDLMRAQLDLLNIQSQADKDKFTNLWCKEAILDLLKAQLKVASDARVPLSVFLIDIDKFKQVNDTYGHQFGDTVIQSVAKLLLQTVRSQDNIGKYGGDEFLVVLPGLTCHGAHKLSDRIKLNLSNTKFENGYRIQCSIGIACERPGPELQMDQIIELADRAMYAAKRGMSLGVGHACHSDLVEIGRKR